MLAKENNMFALLLVSVILGGGTYFLYNYLFTNKSDEYLARQSHFNNKSSSYSSKNDDNNTKEESGYPMKIYFASQSGTAEGLAFDLAKESKKYGFKGEVIDLEGFDNESLSEEKLVIFLVATYGEGEPTDNSQEFYSWLSNSDRSENELSNIEYAVFGLCNSQYEFFNKMGKQFDVLLNKLGGTRLLDLGIGDEDTGSTEDQFSEWKQKLWPILCMKYLGKSIDNIDSKFESTINIHYININDNEEKKEEKKEENEKIMELKKKYGDKIAEMALQIKYPYVLPAKDQNNNYYYSPQLFLPSRQQNWMNTIVLAKVVKKYETRPSVVDGSTLHVEFDINDCKLSNNSNFEYRTADNLGIVAKNDPKMVQQFIKRLKLQPNHVILITPKNEQESLQLKVPKITSINNLFLWYLDINEMPRKQFVKALSQFATDDAEKQELISLSENGIKHESYDTILSILEKYQSVNIDLASIIELLRPLQPRLYTISSSNHANPKTISITIKLEQAFEYGVSNKSGHLQNKGDNNDNFNDDDDKKEKEPIFNGVCSKYVCNMSVENKELVQVYIQPSTFRLPKPNIPVIMVCTGAGLAPFRAFIQECQQHIIKNDLQGDVTKLAPWWLFFGCRFQNVDYLYKDELENALKSKNSQYGCLERLELAFSRQGKEKIYVQDLIKQNQQELYHLISEKKARIYVCGGTSMGKEVRNTFNDILEKYNPINQQGKQPLRIDDMLKDQQYIQELWG